MQIQHCSLKEYRETNSYVFRELMIKLCNLAINSESWYALLIISLCVRLSSFVEEIIASIIDLSECAGGSWFIILNSDSLTRRL